MCLRRNSSCEVCTLTFEHTAEEPHLWILRIQLGRDASVQQRLLLPVRAVQVSGRLEMCGCGFIIDRQRGIRVCERERELTQISQNFGALYQGVSILGIR